MVPGSALGPARPQAPQDAALVRCRVTSHGLSLRLERGGGVSAGLLHLPAGNAAQVATSGTPDHRGRPGPLRSHRRRHRVPGPRARRPDSHRHSQGRQGSDRPAGAAHGPGDRPGHRRTCRGAAVLAGDGRRLDRYAAGRVVRTTTRRAGIAKPVIPHTLRHAFITAALDAGVPPGRCTRGRLARRSADHDAVRPRPREPGPARDLLRRRLPRQRRPVTREDGNSAA